LGGDGASATLGLGRQSEDSSDGRGEPFAVSPPAPHGARGVLMAGLASLSMRRPATGGSGSGSLGGPAFFAASGR